MLFWYINTIITIQNVISYVYFLTACFQMHSLLNGALMLSQRAKIYIAETDSYSFAASSVNDGPSSLSDSDSHTSSEILLHCYRTTAQRNSTFPDQFIISCHFNNNINHINRWSLVIKCQQIFFIIIIIIIILIQENLKINSSCIERKKNMVTLLL